jgi:Ca2+-transporting ATPase
VLTLVLSRGVSQMAAKHAVVKKLHAVEGLGHVDVICTDKTGTLTTNTLVVEDAWAMTDQLLLGAALVGADGDPINAALHTYARDHGVTPDGWHLVDERAFEYQTRSRRTRFEHDGVYRSFVIGSPEHILETSDLADTDRARIQEDILRAAREGLRVIALASRDNDRSLDDAAPWQFAGFVGMSDTLRPRVIDSVAWCRAEGIRVVMITGDHPETAFAIAKQAGIAELGDRVLSGYELELMTDDTLASLLDQVRVFARISPTHKLRIINAYRAAGLITAMTGDGVNDAPALHRADIGIAMGKQGTDVAREASHLVLMDDNFATIIDAIKEGRSTIANVRRVISYLGSTSIAEAGIISVALIAGLPLPLLPGQIIWINLVTDTFLDVSLGMEPAHGSHGEHRGALIDRRSILRMALLGSTMAAGTFAISRQFGYANTAHLQTLTLTTLAVFQWFNAWSARSEHQSIRALPLTSNKPLLVSTGVVIGLQLLAVYAPPLQSLLGTTPLSGSDWITIVEFACTVIVVDEIWKAVQRRRASRPTSS